MKISDMTFQIMTGKLTNDELNALSQAIKFAREQLTAVNACSLRVGQCVKFTNSRSGKTIAGVVHKINRKNVLVKTEVTVWRVPANMLEAA